jgi:hypothetical protein
MLSINAVPSLNPREEIVLPLGLQTSFAGNYKINAYEINNFDIYTEAYLIDAAANITQNLKQNPYYSFDIKPGKAEDRFFLKFVNTSSTGINDADLLNKHVNFLANASGNTLYITVLNQNTGIGNLKIFNTLGQEIINDKVSNGKTSYTLKKGVYIARLLTETENITKKIIIE